MIRECFLRQTPDTADPLHSIYKKILFHIKKLCIFMNEKFSKPIKVQLLDEATDHFDEINDKIRAEFLKSFEKVVTGHKGEWFKHLEDEIWEFRERDGEKFYRIFAFWDSTLEQETLIVGIHGLDKKTNKTPRKEIEKAKRMMNKYLDQKKDKI